MKDINMTFKQFVKKFPALAKLTFKELHYIMKLNKKGIKNDK